MLVNVVLIIDSDLSIDTSKCHPNEIGIAKIVAGTPAELVASAENGNQILNALSLVGTRENLSMPNWIATSQIAWDNTANTVFNVDVPFPISHVYWSLAATAGTSTYWHKDACGLATAIHCKFGKKVWIFRRRDTTRDSSFGHILSDKFDLEGPQKNAEAILLDNTMTM